MIDTIIEVLALSSCMLLGNKAYVKIDKNYSLTKIISSKLNIKQEWKTSFCFLFGLIIGLLILLIINKYIVAIPSIVFFIAIGSLVGISNGLSNQISLIKNKYNIP